MTIRLVRRQLGTNLHLDAFRPWLTPGRIERHVPAIARQGLKHVRIVGEPVLPTTSGEATTDPDGMFEQLTHRCRDYGLAALALCWNVVHDDAASDHPLVAADGSTYPRGHWGLFNFLDPELRRVALDSLQSIMRQLQRHPDVYQDFQPTNEWLLCAYPPHGWSWPAYAGEMFRAEPVPVMFDSHARAQWVAYLEALPQAWLHQVLEEHLVSSAKHVPMPNDASDGLYSPTRLAWAGYRAALIGDFLVDAYAHLKSDAGQLKLLSQSAMPTALQSSGYKWSTLGHNPEYWLARGALCDVLSANCYDSYKVLNVKPGQGDNAYELMAWMMYFDGLVRTFRLEGLSLSEQGANSYFHNEDTQRYLVMRGALVAAAFDLDLHTHLLWNDEPGFEPLQEQFFGVVRDQHLQTKPAGLELARVQWLLERIDPQQRRADPQFIAVAPRLSMDLGMEQWTVDTISGPWSHVSGVTTGTSILRGIPESARAIVLAGEHKVATAALLELLFKSSPLIVVFAGVAQQGPDDVDLREARWRTLTGLGQRPAHRNAASLRAVFVADGVPDLLMGNRQIAGLRAADLPLGAEILCMSADDDVLAYRTNNVVVTAIPLGRAADTIDPELVHWVHVLLGLTVVPLLDLPIEARDEAPLSYHMIGDCLVAINPTDQPIRGACRVRADAEGWHDAVLDVAAGSFSAVHIAAQPSYAVLSGPGTLSLAGRTVINNELDVTVLADDHSVTIDPIANRSGIVVTSVEVNGATTDSVHSNDMRRWSATSGLVSGPVIVTGGSKRSVRAEARYQRVLTLTGTAASERFVSYGLGEGDPPIDEDPQLHTLFTKPSRATVGWSGAPPAGVCLQLSWWTGVDWQEHTSALYLPGAAGEAPLPVPDEYPALVRAKLSSQLQEHTYVSLLYEGEDTVDVLEYPMSSGVVRTRLLHPRRWERYDIVAATATRWHGDRWIPIPIVLAERGTHTRHLQWSEDWSDWSV